MIDSERRCSALAAALMLLVSVTLTGTLAHAETARTIGPTPPRLALVGGEVSFWRSGAEDWTPARVNMPLAAGDSLYAGQGAHFELALGRRAFIRAAANTKLDLASLEVGYLQLELASGRAALDLRHLPEGERLEVDTPQGAVTIDRAGYYRVDVHERDNRTIVTTRRGGPATVIPAGAASETTVAARQQAVLEGTEVASVSTHDAPGGDAFDRWNHTRATQLAGGLRHRRYVSAEVAGVDDLDHAGTWRETSRYGAIWVPHVAADWAPYTAGRWIWDPYYGWTWVDDAWWGWAPYHYGRWVWVGDVWGWAPGPIVAAPVYAPALVAFFGPVGVSVNVGIGFPFVSWVALGFGEPVFPWWGPVGFIGRPFWCGWGGPHIVNNVAIHNTTIVNAGSVRTFQNLAVRNAVAAVPRDQFGRGAVQAGRLTSAQTRQLQPVRGQLGVRPAATSLVAASGRAQRPPDWMQHRQVTATHVPQNPARALRSSGLATDAQSKAAPLRLAQTTGHSGVAARAGGRTMAPPETRPRHAPSSHTVAGAPSHRSLAPARPGNAPHNAPSRTFAHPGTASTFAHHGSYSGHQMSQPRASFRPSRSSYQPRTFQPHGPSGPPHGSMSGRPRGGSSQHPGRHG
jgi:hypothetical protein